MWKHCEACFAETVKNNPDELVKSSALHTFSAFFPFGILEKKTSQVAVLTFGFKTFKCVFVTFPVY